MLPNEKKLQSLIKKTQKKCEAKLAAKQRKTEVNKEVVVENTEASDMFREMKKLPFSE